MNLIGPLDDASWAISTSSEPETGSLFGVGFYFYRLFSLKGKHIDGLEQGLLGKRVWVVYRLEAISPGEENRSGRLLYQRVCQREKLTFSFSL